MTAKRKTLMYLGCLAVSASTAVPSAFAIPPHQPDLVKGGNQWTITFRGARDYGNFRPIR
jgi:hypothetical protein